MREQFKIYAILWSKLHQKIYTLVTAGQYDGFAEGMLIYYR